MMSETFSEVKQRVALRIDAQLRDMTEAERRAFLAKLLDLLPYEQVLSLGFSFETVPGQSEEGDGGNC